MLAVGCTRCSARPGVWCYTVRGRTGFAVFMHAQRQRIAERASRGERPQGRAATSVDPVGDRLIAEMDAVYDRIRAHEFPALVVLDKPLREGRLLALRCPRCNTLVDADELRAVDIAERWTKADAIDDDNFESKRIAFTYDGHGDYGDTVYYRHDDHAVSLPEGWREEG